jgi:outer membrane lipoprotein-sorting protein
MSRWLATGVALAFAVLATAAGAQEPMNTEQMVEVLRTLDERQRNSGDYKSLAYIESHERGRDVTFYEAVVYRRDADDNLMILFLNPKTERGKGYLRIEKNLWMFDPSVGKWERRTERERIAGTDSRRADFDESRLALEYDPSFAGYEKLGKFDVVKLVLQAKAGVDVAYPTVHLWVDKENSNILKRQDFALSGKLMRTGYYPKWQKVFSESKGTDVWYPLEMRFFDEVEKENKTTISIKSVDLNALPANMFTKAWLESQSR